MPINRREFLNLSLATLFTLAFSPTKKWNAQRLNSNGYLWLGRTVSSLRYYDIPSLGGRELGYYITDSVVQVYETKIGDKEPVHNPLWLRTEHGWLHSSSIQPVRNEPATPLMQIPAAGLLGEVCIPFTQAWTHNNGQLKRSYRYYYGTTHWITGVSTDSYGNPWYEILDDLVGGYHYALATDLRIVPSEEVTPIRAMNTEKYIEVNLTEQKLRAFENGRAVFASRCSTGTFDGDTPLGEFLVERKQPSRHMAADEERGNGFDLPGVPWVSFIAWTGVSIHGTYWHHDYGIPRSHGCINLTPAAAKWIYRWTTPNVPAGEDYIEAPGGTRVVVV